MHEAGMPKHAHRGQRLSNFVESVVSFHLSTDSPNGTQAARLVRQGSLPTLAVTL